MVLNEITSLSLHVVSSNKFDFSSYPSLESGSFRLQVLGWCFGFVRALFENVEFHPLEISLKIRLKLPLKRLVLWRPSSEQMEADPAEEYGKDFVEEERKDAYFDFVVGGGEIDCDFPVPSFSFYVASVIVFFVSIICYWNSCNAGFVFDDS